MLEAFGLTPSSRWAWDVARCARMGALLPPVLRFCLLHGLPLHILGAITSSPLQGNDMIYQIAGPPVRVPSHPQERPLGRLTANDLPVTVTRAHISGRPEVAGVALCRCVSRGSVARSVTVVSWNDRAVLASVSLDISASGARALRVGAARRMGAAGRVGTAGRMSSS